MKISIIITAACCSVLIFSVQGCAQNKKIIKPAMLKENSENYRTQNQIQNSQQLNKKLYDAVKAGKYNEIDSHLKNNADINAITGIETPLMFAVRSGDIKMTKYLISRGADINAKITIGNRTPLYNAIMYGKADIVKLLLDKGADPGALVEENRLYTDKTTRMEKNISLIFTAVQAYYSTPQILEMLLKKGADPDVTTSENHRAITEAIYSHKVEQVRLLVNAGTDLNYKEKLPKPQQFRTDKDLTVLEYAYEIKKMCGRPDNLKKSEEIIAIIEAKLNKQQ
jgi:ankyrin repeat protein